MSSCIYILDETLRPLIYKNFKAISNGEESIELFQQAHSKHPMVPVFHYKGIHFVYIRRDGFYFISAVELAAEASNKKSHFNVMAILTYLENFYTLLKRYFNSQKLNRWLIMDNFHLIYELLDESLDFGIPQLTDYNIIQDYIKVQVNLHDELADSSKKISKKEDVHGFEDDESYMNSFIARTTTSAISWRPKGIHYTKNEFFLDVIEEIEYCMDFNKSKIRKNFVHGHIRCRSYLSGMPKLKIGLSKITSSLPKEREQFMNNAKFHQCVSLEDLQKNIVSFIPPDGEFQLCEYKLKRHVRDPPVIKLVKFDVKKEEKKRPKILISLTITTDFKSQNSTSVLNIRIPLTKIFSEYQIDLAKPPRFKCDQGNVLFNLTDDLLLWEVGSIKGGHAQTEHSMYCEFRLYDEEEYKKQLEELKNSMDPPPLRQGPKLEELYKQVHENENTNRSQLVSMEFEIPYYTCSGLKVQYLKIEEDQLQYHSFPWVRYKTVNDEEYAYQI